MKLIPSALALALAVVLGASSVCTHAQPAPVLQLDTNSDNQSDCIFQTENGVRIDGTNAGDIFASGSFTSGDCGTGGSLAAATANLTTSAAVIDVGDQATINWSGAGDICRDNGSVLPAAVAGWPASGDACVGAHECTTGGSISPTFQYSGTYHFKLKCMVGVNAQLPQGDVAYAEAEIQVNGTTVPPTSCDTSHGLVRQMIGSIAIPNGANEQQGVPLQYWEETLGWNFAGTGVYYEWPGIFNNAVKFFIPEQHYVSLQFEVPSTFPLYDPATNTGPSGLLDPSGSAASSGQWTVSISQTCGDFTRPAPGTRFYDCYVETTAAVGGLSWAVMDPSESSSGTCPLERNKTYYLNIVMAPLANPDAGHAETNCLNNLCRYNLKNSGNLSGTYGPRQ